MSRNTMVLILIRMLAVVGFILASAACWSAEPTLARLSFWVPTERMIEFEAAYQEKVVPLLKQHGLVASARQARRSPEGVFSRLYEVERPGGVTEKRSVLQRDSAWAALLVDLGATFETSQPNGQIRYSLGLYIAPAGPGRTATASPGRTTTASPGTGHWRTFDGLDGLANGEIYSIIQDREGYLWFGTGKGGASRYDGKSFVSFTTEDGLVDNRVRSMIQDREGDFWFGTRDGVSRYDGQSFASLTTKDGLVDNRVRSMIQDREGNLWFGTLGGVSRYDGKIFTSLTLVD